MKKKSMYCWSCYQEIPMGSQFCMFCGDEYRKETHSQLEARFDIIYNELKQMKSDCGEKFALHNYKSYHDYGNRSVARILNKHNTMIRLGQHPSHMCNICAFYQTCRRDKANIVKAYKVNNEHVRQIQQEATPDDTSCNEETVAQCLLCLQKS